MNAAEAAKQLTDGYDLSSNVLTLQLGEFILTLRSNSDALVDRLKIYFAHALGSGSAHCEVIAIESHTPDLGVDFIDWKREPGKTGRKDAYVDLADGRLVLKVRTGMTFLQSDAHCIAVGPCLENDNQVINFINAQYMNWLQQNGALICHASGLVMNGRCLGMAGFSGGGKSTLMLKMLEDDRFGYLTNDRLFLNETPWGKVQATGIPKLPRINPGTIVHNDRLRPMLSDKRIAELLAMPKEDLWHLEEKYDVDVEEVYGKGKIIPTAPLAAFLVLKWRRDGSAPCKVEPVNLTERPELLKAIMKSPGPFYQYADGRFLKDDEPLDPAPYLKTLSETLIVEATGKVDFDAAAHQCLDVMEGAQ